MTQAVLMRDGAAQTRTFNYDLTTGRLQSETLPETGTTNYYWNQDGTLAYKIDAKNQKVEYEYDYVYKRVTAMRAYESGGSTLEQSAQFTYDANVLGGSYWGRLSKVEYGPDEGGSPKYTEIYKYSVGGLPLEKRWVVREGTAEGLLTAQWQYNEAGSLTKVTYPGGTSYDVHLDWKGRPNELWRGGTEKEVDGIDWNPAGQLTKMHRPSAGTVTNHYQEFFEYNVRGQLTEIHSASQWQDDPNVHLEYKYPESTNAGRVWRTKKQFSGDWKEEVDYTYDSLNRLVSAETTTESDVTWGLAFGFDGFGNRTSQTVTQGSGPTWSTATNRVNAYSYDLNGNVTGMPGKTLTWDVLNRLTRVVESAGTEEYDYAPSGQRVRWERSDGQTTERYVFYGARGERMEEFLATVNGGTITFSSLGRDVYFAGRLIYQKGEQVFTDRLGSVALRREGGSWKAPKYYPYGELRAGATDEDQTGFATYDRSALTGLDYAQQRWYASGAGRFLSADPYRASGGAGNPGSWNRYAYVEGDPVNYGDPGGLMIFVPPQLGVGIACTTVWTTEGAAYVCRPEFVYTVAYFGEDTLADQQNQGGGGGIPGDGPIARFSRLSEPCRYGLMTAMPAAAGTAPSVRAQLRLDALSRAGGVTGILARAAGQHGIDWELLAAIGIRETGFLDTLERGGGHGAGVFQIDLGQNPSVAEEQARDLEWAADWAANRLATNMADLAAAHPSFNSQQLLRATAASYNFGIGNISGNPGTIDVGSTGGNYGANILNLMECF